MIHFDSSRQLFRRCRSRLLGCHTRAAFTLVELLAVIAIIGVLVGLLLPAVQAARESGRRSTCLNNVKQLALGLANYHDANKKFPAAFKAANTYANGAATNTYGQGISWVAYVLPFIEQASLANKIDFTSLDSWTGGSGDPNYSLAVNNMPSYLLCPSIVDPKDGREAASTVPRPPFTSHYYGIMGVVVPSGPVATAYPNYTADGNSTGGNNLSSQGIFPVSSMKQPSSVSAKDVTDGLSKTFLVGEISWSGMGSQGRSHTASFLSAYNNAAGSYIRSARNIYYPRPINISKYEWQSGSGVTAQNGWNNLNWGSNHPSGTHFAMADGSVDFVMENIDMVVFMAAGSRNCGE